MKKMIMTLAIALSTFVAFAGEENENVSQDVLSAFKKEFGSANQVEWTTGNNYYRAAFIYNSKHVLAFYNTEGELIGLTRYMSSTDLPLGLEMSLKKKYSNYWISDLFEVAKNDSTSYYITLENADAKIVLKSAGGNEWEVYTKTKKI
jgi:hypothetical protein